MILHVNTAVITGTQRDQRRLPGGGDTSRAGMERAGQQGGSKGEWGLQICLRHDPATLKIAPTSDNILLGPRPPVLPPSLSTVSFALGSPLQACKLQGRAWVQFCPPPISGLGRFHWGCRQEPWEADKVACRMGLDRHLL